MVGAVPMGNRLPEIELKSNFGKLSAFTGAGSGALFVVSQGQLCEFYIFLYEDDLQIDIPICFL